MYRVQHTLAVSHRQQSGLMYDQHPFHCAALDGVHCA